MAYLDFIKPDMRSYSNFANHKSAIACAFCRVFGFDLGKDVLVLQGLKGRKIEQMLEPRHDPDEDG